MTWLTPDTWAGMNVPIDYSLQYLRFEGIDRDTGYIWYKTAPLENKLLSVRQKLGMGGLCFQLHIFCGDQEIYDAVEHVIHDHPDTQKEYKWTMKGCVTWFNTNKLILCDKVKEFVQKCEKELLQRSNGRSRLEVLSMEVERRSFRHCFLCLRRSGFDLEPRRYIAINDLQEQLTVIRMPDWEQMLYIVTSLFSEAALLILLDLRILHCSVSDGSQKFDSDLP